MQDASAYDMSVERGARIKHLGFISGTYPARRLCGVEDEQDED